MKEFKFSTEAALSVVSDDMKIICVEDINLHDDISIFDEYNIYGVLSCTRYYFDHKNIKLTPSGLSTAILNNVDESVLFIPSLDLNLSIERKTIDTTALHPYAKIICDEPFSEIKIVFVPNNEKTNEIIAQNGLTCSCDELKEIFANNFIYLSVEEVIFNMIEKREQLLELELLYIGQAQGRDIERNAVSRLKNHETLQKILMDYHARHPNKRLYIMLFPFTENQIMMFNGIEDLPTFDNKDDVNHKNRLIQDAIAIRNNDENRKRQIINITEAALINYFKPYYNTTFVNNFPSAGHSSYRHYYDLEYNLIVVELHRLYGVKVYTDTKSVFGERNFIEYELFKDNRESIFNIFEHIKRADKQS